MYNTSICSVDNRFVKYCRGVADKIKMGELITRCRMSIAVIDAVTCKNTAKFKHPTGLSVK